MNQREFTERTLALSERFHLDLRRILQKGVSFNQLDQNQINLIMSQLDSYPRPSLGGRTPYDMFIEEFGDDGKSLLDKLGIVRIPADEVTLHPFLLGRKFQSAVDKAVLKKNGVIGEKIRTLTSKNGPLTRAENQPDASKVTESLYLTQGSESIVSNPSHERRNYLHIGNFVSYSLRTQTSPNQICQNLSDKLPFTFRTCVQFWTLRHKIRNAVFYTKHAWPECTESV